MRPAARRGSRRWESGRPSPQPAPPSQRQVPPTATNQQASPHRWLPDYIQLGSPHSKKRTPPTTQTSRLISLSQLRSTVTSPFWEKAPFISFPCLLSSITTQARQRRHFEGARDDIGALIGIATISLNTQRWHPEETGAHLPRFPPAKPSGSRLLFPVPCSLFPAFLPNVEHLSSLTQVTCPITPAFATPFHNLSQRKLAF